jgi:hypothetical protein
MTMLRAAMTGFDITPRLHPECGAWGCNPTVTEVESPLVGRCLALEADGEAPVIWFGADLVGDSPQLTDALRQQVAEILGLPPDRVLWGTCQNHSSGAPPWAEFSGDVNADLSRRDPSFMAAEAERVQGLFCTAAAAALEQLQPVSVSAGRGYCDSVSFNTRYPLPDGGVKYCRHQDEAAHSGRPIDPAIGLVRFDDQDGKHIGAVFNFNMHVATMISQEMISSDWVGPARTMIEEALGGAPVLYAQGFCSDINCYHLFGRPHQARATGQRLGAAAVTALSHLAPVRSLPLRLLQRELQLQCQPMPSRQQLESEIAAMEQFIADLEDNPDLLWCCDMNCYEKASVPMKRGLFQSKIDYRREGLRLLDAGEQVRGSLPYTVGVLRIGDVAAVLAPGEPFAETGLALRQRSPFVHNLICGDINGLFGQVFTDEDIRRGGSIIDSYFEILALDGFRLPPAPGSEQLLIQSCLELLHQALQD